MDDNTNIAGSEPVIKGGEWVVDALEIMDGVRDEDEAASEAVTMQPEGGGEGEFRLKHLDEVRTVDRDKVIELAQKGLDYDRVRAKLDSARDELDELKSWMGEVSGGKDAGEFRDELSARALSEREGVDYAAALERVKSARAARTGVGEGARRRKEAREFVAAYPEVAARLLHDRGAIPDEVWQRVRGGESLNAAYESVRLRSEAKENGERVRELERELAETRQAKRNAERATGSAASAGGDVERDMAAIGWNEV